MLSHATWFDKLTMTDFLDSPGIKGADLKKAE